jgi:hypothetical protein
MRAFKAGGGNGPRVQEFFEYDRDSELSGSKQAARIQKFLADNKRLDLYFAVAPRRERSGRGEACLHLNALFADIDYKHLTSGQEKEEAFSALMQFGITYNLWPGAIVESGGGLHVYWPLTEPLPLGTAEQRNHAKSLLRRIAAALGIGDPNSAEPVHILRVPGTLNHKYNPPRPVTLMSMEAPDEFVALNTCEQTELEPRAEPGAPRAYRAKTRVLTEWFLPECKYDIAQFEKLPPEPEDEAKDGKPSTGKRRKFKMPGEVGEGRRNDTLFKLTRSLKAQGLGEDAIRNAVHAENETKCHPPIDSGELTGWLDDWLTRDADFWTNQQYIMTDTGTFRSVWMPGKNSTGHFKEVRLSNFPAWIVQDITRDDGVEKVQEFKILTRSSGGGEQTITVPSAQFKSMQWVMQLGSRAILEAGNGIQDHFRAAIQYKSNATPRTLYTHTGWRELGGKWLYLFQGGAIGEQGAVSGIETDLPGPLAKMTLPEPPKGADLIAAVLASLRMLEVGKDRVSVPAFCATYRAVLDRCNMSIFFNGTTGLFKSELASLMQRHFGVGFDAENLPANWFSTPKSAPELAFLAKDVLVVFDDYKPGEDLKKRSELQAAAELLLRGAGNNQGRAFLDHNRKWHAGRPPRALIVSTGEELPTGKSLRARMFIVEVNEGDVPVDRLTACQRDAAAGLYVQAMAAFIQWLAPQMGEMSKRVERERQAFQTKMAKDKLHRRTPTAVADLFFGAKMFLDFALRIGAIDSSGDEKYRARIEKALIESAERQAKAQQETDPALRYIELVRSALGAGRAHIASFRGAAPLIYADALGWRPFREALTPQGLCIGWIDEVDDIYLDPDAAYKVAQEMTSGNDRVDVGVKALNRRLHEAGLLKTTDTTRGTKTARRKVGGSQREVLHINAELLIDKDRSVPAVTEDKGEDSF